MSDFVISEDKLSAIEIILKQAGIQIKRNVLLTEIRSRKLSTELETAYRHGFNDGQAEGLPEALKAERERMIKSILTWIRFDDGMIRISAFKEYLESLRSEPCSSSNGSDTG